ncbi:pyruvate kinase [Peteryoungia desertarenae]|uniref:Pyruvate kinase n=1 Tax=Peteryoungia desertarenae TaxID=1813451 RepID=A0ABX6QM08_9HYPH|nr:pyruvate kinase [Peteryoungia desertarenae]QLF69307.1 pyruvate kinase [Peteryoungia desertarenae]
MNTQEIQSSSLRAASLLEEVLELREAVLSEAVVFEHRFAVDDRTPDQATRNLAHYLALRRKDLRILQRRLMALGLSSLGRLEGRVLPTLDAVAHALASLAGREAMVSCQSETAFFTGESELTKATTALMGEASPGRRTRVMVTLPGTAAENPELIRALAHAGMNIARINCAHDGPDAWRAMTAFVKEAAQETGREIRILMDIAGPKIRTGEISALKKKGKLQAGDRIRLIATGTPEANADLPFAAAVSLPEMVTRLAVGNRLRYDDGKLDAVVEAVSDGEAVIRVERVKAGGVKLKPEKGINLPDTALGLSPLTAKDELDLATVVECADMIGYSFVSRPDDIDLLDGVLARLGQGQKPIGLIAKIEQPAALANLPDLMVRARRRGPFGVMIARGDLAAEIGFERLAEMQEEILWLCEAASVPCVWATQVLEDMVKEGIPTRSEMTDAAMAARAECVMLNKGPAIVDAVSLLDRLLCRMDEHVFKKTPTLRALKSW